MSKKENIKNTVSYTISIQMWQDCNLSCIHCWRDAKMGGKKLKLDLVINNISDYMLFLKEKHKGDNLVVFISLTGGEIFLDFDKVTSIFGLLEIYDFIKIGLLTNGTLIKDKHLDFLEKFKERIDIQISIDGFQKIHDEIRGEGTFKKSISTVKKLGDLGFKVRIQSVITEKNIHELAGLIIFFCELPIKDIGFRKLLLKGRAKDIITNGFDTNKYIEDFYSIVEKMHDYVTLKSKKLVLGCDVAGIIKKYKSLEKFTGTCGVITNNIIGIEPDGTIFLCSRLPIKNGNIYQDSLNDINRKYDDFVSKIFSVSDKCNSCSELQRCKGGDLCDIYITHGNIKGHTSFLCKD